MPSCNYKVKLIFFLYIYWNFLFQYCLTNKGFIYNAAVLKCIICGFLVKQLLFAKQKQKMFKKIYFFFSHIAMFIRKWIDNEDVYGYKSVKINHEGDISSISTLHGLPGFCLLQTFSVTPREIRVDGSWFFNPNFSWSFSSAAMFL